MNESTVEKSIFVSPPIEFETDWSGGDELTLSLKDTLAQDQTYVFTVGSGALDMQKNRMSDSYQFAFSTGKFIDRGEIYGRIFNIDQADVFSIYAYREIDPDSVDPARVKADFLSQSGPDGSFWLRYLPLEQFRIFVIEDVNKNLILDAATERIGIPSRDVRLDSTNSFTGPLHFILTKIDTTRPEISGARAMNKHTAILRISEIIEDLSPEHISISDTLVAQKLAVKGISRNREDRKQFYIYTADHDSAKGYRLTVMQMSDTSGNTQMTPQFVDFAGSHLIDTTNFELIKVTPPDSAVNAELSGVVSIEFSLPVDTQQVPLNFAFWNADSLLLPGKWTWPDLQHGFFQPAEELTPGLDYYYSFTTRQLQSLWGDTLADSTIQRTFFTISEDEFGSLSGELQIDRMPGENTYIQIIPLEKKKKTQMAIIDPRKKFIIPWVTEGQYKIGGFIDLDGNAKYSPGQLNPFVFSEPFTIQDDTLRVRKRWELSDLKLLIPDL
jgi:hypothetical protein